MKTLKYTSVKYMDFDNALACELDNQTSITKFIELWRFIADFNHDALYEWLNKMNYSKNLEHVVETLQSLNKLQKP